MRKITKQYLKTFFSVIFISTFLRTFQLSITLYNDGNQPVTNQLRDAIDLSNDLTLKVVNSSWDNSEGKIKMLIAVISSASNFEARQTIRQAWKGSSRKITDKKGKMLWNTTIGMCIYGNVH